MNANKINFNLKEKKTQAKTIFNKNEKKENQNILHANSVLYLQSFCLFYKCTLYMQQRKKSKSKSNVFTSDPDIKPVEDCSNPYLYTSKYIINKVGTIK